MSRMIKLLNDPFNRQPMGEEDLTKFRANLRTFGRHQLVVAEPGVHLSQGHVVTKWDGNLSKTLLQLVGNISPLQRDEIFSKMWKGLPVKEATNVFHVSKRKIGEAIEAALAHVARPIPKLTLYQGGFYNFNPEWQVSHDRTEFDYLYNELTLGEPEPEDPVTGWLKAASLIGGEFMEGHELDDQKWLEDMRAVYRSKRLRVYKEVGAYHPDFLEAKSYLEKALRIDPLYDGAVLTLMLRYDERHEYQAALDVYNAFRKAWMAQHHREPFATIRTYADQIERHLEAETSLLRDE